MVSQTGLTVVRSNCCKGPNPTWKRAKKEPKGQTKILEPARVVCCLSQKDQPCNPGPNAASSWAD